MIHHAAPRHGATIVAFDGLVADTRLARGLAVSEAVTAEFMTCSLAEALGLVEGRSLDEAVDAAFRAAQGSSSAPLDDTARDLAVLRARRGFGAMVSRGLSLRDGAAAWLAERASTHGRIVLRAESARRDVERLLAFSGIEDLAYFTRCADDLPRVRGGEAVDRSWQAIMARLAAQQVVGASCAAFEVSSRCADVAHRYAAEVTLLPALG